MEKYGKLLTRILIGQSDADVPFVSLCTLLEQLGFDKRVKGSHHIFRKYGIEEKLNLQKDGSKAKSYQVKQVRNIILKYKLGVNKDV